MFLKRNDSTIINVSPAKRFTPYGRARLYRGYITAGSE